jgi:HAD superfamily phosphoserine phosphatase-like hydrolase
MATPTGTLKGFIADDPETVKRKVERFTRYGSYGLHFVFDFDYTLTVGKNATAWELLHSLLPEAGQLISQEMRTKYLAIEAAGKLSEEDTHNWTTSELDLHTSHGTSFLKIEEAAKSMRLRPGVRELFRLCAENDIPTVVLSAGISDIIEVIMREHGIQPTLILSIRLYLADDGRVIGWDNDTMIHTLNKHEKGDVEISNLRKTRPFTVLIGDTLDDASMVKGAENVLRIRTCDPAKNETEAERQAFRKASFSAGYDLIIEDDLLPVVRLLEQMTASR